MLSWISRTFKNVIVSSNSGKVDVVELGSADILAWRAGHSVAQLKKAPYLLEMAAIQFRRGPRKMWVKRSHDQEEFMQLDFLIKKATLDFPERLKPGEKGVEKQKKET